jgi:iron(III)-enterobactin esterase
MRSAVLFVLCVAVLQVAEANDDLPPFRSPDGPGAPNWTVVGAPPRSAERRGAAGMNALVNQNGDFLIGPDYLPAPEWKFVPGTPCQSIHPEVQRQQVLSRHRPRRIRQS